MESRASLSLQATALQLEVARVAEVVIAYGIESAGASIEVAGNQSASIALLARMGVAPVDEHGEFFLIARKV
jgi:hypothetical protein